MFERILILLSALWLGITVQAQSQLVILYDNDVHCAVRGYPALAGIRDSLQRQGIPVAVVSSGDFSFGAPIGASSKGEYVMRMMNAVGYDAVCLGNHEFDYGMAQLRHLANMSYAPMICCNYKHIDSTASVFLPYALRSIGGHTIAFVGMTTPTTISAAEPTTFQDLEGRYIYTFSSDNLVQEVQKNINSARAAGAEVVVVLSHMGDSDSRPNSVQIISQLTGVDLVLDGHDHHVLPTKMVSDKNTKQVTLSSTGSQFKYIGMATLTFDSSALTNVSTRLIPTDSLLRVGCVNRAVSDTLAVVQALFEAQGQTLVTKAPFPLIAEENAVRVCRLRETNLGDLIADAYRVQMNADVAIVNGGSIRANINPGDVTHNTLYAVLPFSNMPIAIKVKGQAIIDALETAVREYPRAEGCFAQVSGLQFTIDTTIESTVLLSPEGKFLQVKGARRVSNVIVGSKPISPDDSYTIAGPEYLLRNGGDGFYFPEAEVVRQSSVTDLMLLEAYLQREGGNSIPEIYRNPQSRILFK